MAVFKLCLLLLALTAVTFTFANPAPAETSANPEGEEEDIPASDNVEWSEIRSEFHDAEDVADDPSSEVEGVPLQGRSEAQIEALLDVENNLVDHDMDEAVDDTEDAGNGTRRKRETTFHFRVWGDPKLASRYYSSPNWYYIYHIEKGTYSTALAQFSSYMRAGAFRHVWRLVFNRRVIGYMGFVGRTSNHRVIVRNGLYGSAPSLTFWVYSRYIRGQWTLKRFYYLSGQ